MNKIYKCYRNYEYTINKKKYLFICQVYKTSIYGITNNDPKLQRSYTPFQIESIQRKLKKLEKNKEITNLQFGRLMKITKDKNGFWKEIK